MKRIIEFFKQIKQRDCLHAYEKVETTQTGWQSRCLCCNKVLNKTTISNTSFSCVLR
jgi:hypothetical protein